MHIGKFQVLKVNKKSTDEKSRAEQKENDGIITDYDWKNNEVSYFKLFKTICLTTVNQQWLGANTFMADEHKNNDVSLETVFKKSVGGIKEKRETQIHLNRQQNFYLFKIQCCSSFHF